MYGISLFNMFLVIDSVQLKALLYVSKLCDMCQKQVTKKKIEFNSSTLKPQKVTHILHCCWV